MISEIRYPDGRIYVCDDCRGNIARYVNIRSAKTAGWAISRDYKHCYCPDCAPRHRHTGRGGYFNLTEFLKR